MNTLYLSADLPTAVAEYEQDIGIRPGTFCAYDVTTDCVLDLTDPAVPPTVGLKPEDCFAPWKSIFLVQRGTPPGWGVVTRVIQAGGAGVIVPSAQFKGGTNLVLWRWNDGADRQITALDPQTDLPRDQASWR